MDPQSIAKFLALDLKDSKPKDIPKIMLRTVEYLDTFSDLKGPEKKKLALDVVTLVIKGSNIDPNIEETLEATLEGYLAISKGLVLINKVSDGKCCSIC